MPFSGRNKKKWGKKKKWKCERCERKRSKGFRLEFHHRVPTSAGGSDEEHNAELLCIECHYIRHLELEQMKIGHKSANIVKARLDRIGLYWNKELDK